MIESIKCRCDVIIEVTKEGIKRCGLEAVFDSINRETLENSGYLSVVAGGQLYHICKEHAEHSLASIHTSLLVSIPLPKVSRCQDSVESTNNQH